MRYLPLLFLVTIFSCKQPPKGEALATQYCSTCHMAVSPALLDKKTWLDHVLPAMAPKLGIGVWGDNSYYPGTAPGAISISDWHEIVKYYKELAPDSLEAGSARLKEDAALFTMHVPVWKDTSYRATTTMVSIDPHTGGIYSSSETTLYKWDTSLQATVAMELSSPGVDMDWTAPDTAVLTCIGNLRAVDQLAGVLYEVGPAAYVHTVAMGLPRPVQSVRGDFNKDGVMDEVVLGFGHKYGGLYLLDGEQKKVIREVPGAIHAEKGDFNHDGYLDLMVLFAYDDESIWLFLNDHRGGFTGKQVLRFPPVYGSTSFQLVDMNKDGRLDIVYTSGDNGDYSMELKPYHGVYIFLDKGDFRFESDKPDYFYHVNGATRVIVADFDGDGDQDMASIAFFADLAHNPAEQFVYFEQKGSLSFDPHTVKGLSGQGRWISMAAGDYDRDGDMDLVLGSYSRGFIIQEGYQPAWNIYQPLVLLENNTH